MDPYLDVVAAYPRNEARDHLGMELYPRKQGIELSNSNWLFQMVQYNNGVLIASLFVKGRAQDLRSSDARVVDAKETLESICKHGILSAGKQQTTKEVPKYWSSRIMKIIKSSSQKPGHE